MYDAPKREVSANTHVHVLPQCRPLTVCGQAPRQQQLHRMWEQVPRHPDLPGSECAAALYVCMVGEAHHGGGSCAGGHRRRALDWLSSPGKRQHKRIPKLACGPPTSVPSTPPAMHALQDGSGCKVPVGRSMHGRSHALTKHSRADAMGTGSKAGSVLRARARLQR